VAILFDCGQALRGTGFQAQGLLTGNGAPFPPKVSATTARR
jgi:hypothetical protein